MGDSKKERFCPTCEVSGMYGALDRIHKRFRDEYDTEGDYAASQLVVAFVSAQASLLVLRDLFIQYFGETGIHSHGEISISIN